MAVKWKARQGRPMNAVIYQFMQDTVGQLQSNLFTQRIYPNEVYPGYEAINNVRRLQDSWYSTGEGAKSFRAQILNANEAGDITLAFEFLDYMRFVDMGVGQGTKINEVDSAKKAKYQSRYVSSWNRWQGHSQRPAIMMELRHLQTRITGYIQDYYGYEGQAYIVDNVDGIELHI